MCYTNKYVDFGVRTRASAGWCNTDQPTIISMMCVRPIDGYTIASAVLCTSRNTKEKQRHYSRPFISILILLLELSIDLLFLSLPRPSSITVHLLSLSSFVVAECLSSCGAYRTDVSMLTNEHMWASGQTAKIIHSLSCLFAYTIRTYRLRVSRSLSLRVRALVFLFQPAYLSFCVSFLFVSFFAFRFY